MTAVPALLAPIRAESEGLTDLCPEHLRQGIRHLQRNCDIDCNTHDDELNSFDCNQPDRHDGARMADALASIPRLLAALDAVLALHPCEAAGGPDGTSYAEWCPACSTYYPCPTVAAVVAALQEGE